MKIDFHLHVKLNKKVDFSEEYFTSMINEAKQEGLTAITLTEHFNTKRFLDIYDFLNERYEYKQDYYDIDGFRLFPGMEVDVKEGGHILIIGDREDIRAIRLQLIGYETEDTFVSMKTLLSICQPFDILCIGAHPLRSSNPLLRIPEEDLMQVDCFDLNGKDLNYGGVEEMREQVYQFAKRYDKPVVGGSDTHYPMQVGSIVNVFDEECTTVKQLKQSIANGAYKIEISPCLPTKVRAADMIKKMLVAEQVKQHS
ncbi:PHP-associated domain-containing protein [Niallia sp. 01092]|uniref:PHP-associated domain-containing protein n=1 Tax=unclassified Niallia TaxID=2837522 RepID=UPI003FD5C84E